ncbi:MAG: flagellar brake protein [Spirochaetaceae bacterium]
MNNPIEDFATAFSSTPVEVAMAVAFILLFVFFFALLFVRQRKAEKERQALEAQRKYREYLDSTSMSPLDRVALEELASRIRVPGYRLFEEQGLFNRAAKAAREAGTLERAQIAALRVKLGFAGSMVGSKPSSSTEIPMDSQVLLTDRRNRRFAARVLPPTTGAFRVEPKQRVQLPPTGSPVKVVYEGDGGVFSFESHVLRNEGEIVELQHSEDLEGSQRREHARRLAEVPVELEPLDGNGDRFSSVTVDIGGGGATIVNPERRFRRNEELQVTLYFAKEEELEVTAKVIRVSENGEHLHLKWVAIPEGKRDRIYGFLFRQGAHRHS